MKERPILFSSPMVRAILEGKKTQTRRVVTPGLLVNETYPRCRYGVVGDRLWVRENFWYDVRDPKGCVVYSENVRKFKYRVDSLGPRVQDAEEPISDDWPKKHKFWKQKPSIFMPRWASRITLEIVDVRVEPLQNITEADAIAEGFSYYHGVRSDEDISARDQFGNLWNTLNKERGFGWDLNPWVWVVSFKRIEVAAGVA